MPRYIDSEKIKYTKFVPENDTFDGAGGLCALKSHIDAIPTADVVEVVRCKDCKFRGTDDCLNSYYSEYEGAHVDPMDDDDFCSYGERRKENAEIH